MCQLPKVRMIMPCHALRQILDDLQALFLVPTVRPHVAPRVEDELLALKHFRQIHASWLDNLR